MTQEKIQSTLTASEVEQSIMQMQDTLEQYKRMTKVKSKLDKLKELPEFKELFEDFFFKDEILRCNLLSVSGNANVEIKANSTKRAQALALMQIMFMEIDVRGNEAVNYIEKLESDIKESNELLIRISMGQGV